MERETIVYNGTAYHRYPESDHRQLRKYYWAHTENGESPTALHRAKWIHHHGSIPEGHVIHHKDGDSTNNDIENLTCMERGKHQSMHVQEWLSDDENYKELCEQLDEAREKASEWHGSEEGKEWHKEHYENTKEELYKERYTHECDYCGEEYTTNRKEKTRFCSDDCQQKQYRKENQEERKCDECGEVYEVYKHSKAKYCDEHGW